MTTSIFNAPDAVTRTDVSPGAEPLLPPSPPSVPPSDSAADVVEVPHTIWSRFIVLMLCLAVVTTTLAFGTVHSWALAAFQLSAGLVVVLWILDAWRTQKLRFSRSLLQVPLAGLILLGLVQLLPLGSAANPGMASGILSTEPVQALSYDPYATRLIIIQAIALFVYFGAALAFIDSPGRLRLVVRVVVIFGFILALFGLMQYFLNPYVIYWVKEPKQAQPFGPYINRHHFAGYMELALALPLGLLFSGAIDRDRIPLYAFFSLMMAIALVMTNSRGGMLSVAAEVLFLVVIGMGLGRRREEQAGGSSELLSRVRAAATRLAVGFGLLATLFLFALYSGGEESLSRLVGTVNDQDPTTGRAHFWKGTIEIFKDHPILGTGLGSFSAVYPRYDTGNGQYRLEQAHNDYLQILSDGGLIGGALGLVFVVVLLRKGFARLSSRDKFRRGVALGALSGCVGVLVHSFFDFTLHTAANALLFLVLAALATMNGRIEAATPRRKRKRRREGSIRQPSTPFTVSSE